MDERGGGCRRRLLHEENLEFEFQLFRKLDIPIYKRERGGGRGKERERGLGKRVREIDKQTDIQI